MNCLIDTHAFLWWITDSPRLSERAHTVLGDGRNAVFFSAASGWEIAIKSGLGKLRLPDDPARYIPDQLRKNNVEPLPVQLYHTLHVSSLPLHHRDPFDRLLVSQSILEKLPILTSDEVFQAYEVETIW